MKLIALLLTAVLFLGMDANAQTTSRQKKADTLAQLMGLAQELDAAKQEGAKQALAQVRQVMVEIRKANFPPEAEAEIARLSESYSLGVERSWDSKEAALIYVNAITEQMSEEEMEESIRYLTSEAGKKSQSVIQSANSRLNEYIYSRMSAASERETKILLDKILAIRARMGPPGQSVK